MAKVEGRVGETKGVLQTKKKETMLERSSNCRRGSWLSHPLSGFPGASATINPNPNTCESSTSRSFLPQSHRGTASLHHSHVSVSGSGVVF